MTSFLKRQACKLLVLAAAAAAAFSAFPAPSRAAVESVAESGGRHWRYETAANGPVHVWVPGSYDPSTAITVVHVHGDAEGYVGSYTPGKYSDKAWTAMKLADQFRASGLNALFIFPDGPVNRAERDAGTRIWRSLDALLSSVRTNIGQQIPEKVVVSGHSGAYATIRRWTGDARIAAFVLLDSTYDAPSTYSGWYAGGASRRVAYVHTGTYGGSYLPAKHAKTFAEATGAKVLDRIPGTTADLSAQAGAKRAVVMGSQYSHAAIVSSGAVIPVLLPWAAQAASASAPPGGTATGATPGPSGGLTVRPQTDADYGGPTLEIPIPNVSFTDALRRDGEVTIPWLAQYVGGVYLFLLSVVGVVAAVMMMFGGFQYVTAAGDKGRLGAGKKRIVDALTGLVLALGSYTILYAINPELVAFDGLKVGSVQTIEIFQAEDGINKVMEADPLPPGSPGKPSAICNTKASCQSYCDLLKTDPSKIPQVAPGMASPSDVQTIPNDIPGVKGYGKQTSPSTIALLRRVGPMFAADGYVLHVTSGYRDLRGQFKLACDAWAAGLDSRVGSTIANPGGSFHGVGFAIDVQLWKDGKRVTMSGNSTAQQQQDPVTARYLAETMLKAGFRRLNNEIWHFEPANAPATQCRCYRIEDCSMPPAVKC